MRPRLGIIVPYRDRAEHLDAFVAHTPRFFAEDAANRDIPCRYLIVEQGPGRDFNRGALLNVGFQLLAAEVDYVCFHDVDRLPLAADYGWPEQPTMAIFHGLNFKPEFIRSLLSSVVLLQKPHFLAANGFSNQYWGWGFEDVDLRERLLRCGLRATHREGRFQSLPHLDLGSEADGSLTPAARRNQRIYVAQWFEQMGSGWRRQATPSERWQRDGLNSVAYAVLQPRRRLRPDARPYPIIDHVLIGFDEPL